jgi:hypothetical protein
MYKNKTYSRDLLNPGYNNTNETLVDTAPKADRIDSFDQELRLSIHEKCIKYEWIFSWLFILFIHNKKRLLVHRFFY